MEPKIDNSEVTKVVIHSKEFEDFAKSSQSVALGYTEAGLLFNTYEGLFDNCFILRPAKDDNPKENNVRFYKDKAFEYVPNTYIVENLQTDKPKAFYIEDDGAKRELMLRIDEKGGEEKEMQVTDMMCNPHP